MPSSETFYCELGKADISLNGTTMKRHCCLFHQYQLSAKFPEDDQAASLIATRQASFRALGVCSRIITDKHLGIKFIGVWDTVSSVGLIPRWAVNQGHYHLWIVATLCKQVQKLTLSSRAFYNSVLGRFAQVIMDMFGYGMVLPMNTGAEAVEAAINLARKWAYLKKGAPEGKAVMLSVKGNFHGRTVGVISCQNNSKGNQGEGRRMGAGRVDGGQVRRCVSQHLFLSLLAHPAPHPHWDVTSHNKSSDLMCQPAHISRLNPHRTRVSSLADTTMPVALSWTLVGCAGRGLGVPISFRGFQHTLHCLRKKNILPGGNIFDQGFDSLNATFFRHRIFGAMSKSKRMHLETRISTDGFDSNEEERGGMMEFLRKEVEVEQPMEIWRSSTGQPKGVEITRSNLSNWITSAHRSGYFLMGPFSRVLQFATFAFDAAVLKWSLALSLESNLCFANTPLALIGDHLADVIDKNLVTHMHLTPSMLGTLPASRRLQSLECISVGGEMVPDNLIERWRTRVTLQNATVVMAHQPQPSSPGKVAPCAANIGKPHSSTEVFVCNPSFNRLLAVNEIGENGKRMYKTGDRGKLLADGTVFLMGRMDRELEVRGYRCIDWTGAWFFALTPTSRIDLDDLERTIVDVMPSIISVSVQSSPDGTELKRLLDHRVPSYMVPRNVYCLQRLPLNTSDKTDHWVIKLRMEELIRNVKLLSGGTTPCSMSSDEDDLSLVKDFSRTLTLADSTLIQADESISPQELTKFGSISLT
ncbi:unnamed protein product [Mycena citricolor]|uniref:AMP-dependent synthetase/ligase domain-containing protein n=1 Tax=Mycena citricolor TaxID=2018698 RepID=A0AAD2K4Y9_9AGAR|nr:unnamed protein product [Mycena citricolor]